MDMKMKKPKMGGHISSDQSANPLFRKQPELEMGIGKIADRRRSEKNMKKIMQQVDAIRIANMIIDHDKK
jgi:hypothetical protein